MLQERDINLNSVLASKFPGQYELPTIHTYLSTFNELLHDVSSLDYGQLPQNIAHHPDSQAIEELDAFLDVGCILRRLGGMSIHTELM